MTWGSGHALLVLRTHPACQLSGAAAAQPGGGGCDPGQAGAAGAIIYRSGRRQRRPLMRAAIAWTWAVTATAGSPLEPGMNRSS